MDPILYDVQTAARTLYRSETPAEGEAGSSSSTSATAHVAVADSGAAGGSTSGNGIGSARTGPSLDEELDQIARRHFSVGQSIGSMWDNVRRQSLTAYDTSRRELEQYAQVAKKDLDQFAMLAKGELTRLGEPSRSHQATATSSGQHVEPSAAESAADTGASESVRSEQDSTSACKSTPTPSPSSAVPVSALFSRLQSQLSSSPNLTAIQKNITSFKASLPGSPIDSQHLAEGYLDRGAAFFRDVGKELGGLLNNAVKVVPPDELGSTVPRRKKADVATRRRDALVIKIRNDPAIILVDPAQPPAQVADEAKKPAATEIVSGSDAASDTPLTPSPAEMDTRECYARFLQSIEDHGGFETESWRESIDEELAAAHAAGHSLRSTLGKLVPSQIPSEVFWSRYFFRIRQIDEDETRRKQVLQATQSNDEDFSWDLEDEEPLSKPASLHDSFGLTQVPSTPTPVERDSTPKLDSSTTSEIDDWGHEPASRVVPLPRSASQRSVAAPSSPIRATGTAETSPRDSSECTGSSYDVVGVTSSFDTTKPSARASGKDAEDGDSDWE